MESEPQSVHALVVVDLQQAFVTGEHAVPDARSLLTVVTRQVAAARRAGSLVVHLQNHGPDGTPDARGTDGWRLVLDALPGEPVLAKTGDDGFTGTDLERVLRDAGAEVLSLCGLMSEMCVAATARGALRRGFGVVLARDAHATCDIPEQGRHAPPVPARLVSRVAEWSLGDELVAVDHSDDVRFVRP